MKLLTGSILTVMLLCPLLGHAQTAPAAPIAPAPSATPAPPMKRPSNRVEGMVTATNAAQNTITLTPRHADAPVTLTLTPNARVLVSGPGSVAALKTGDRINVIGAVTPDTPTVTAERITVQPAGNRRPPQNAPGRDAGFRRNGVEGIVATTAPALTITTPGNITVTVTTTPTTQVEAITLGGLADIAVGSHIQARISGDPAAAALMASEVRVLPAQAAPTGRRHHPRTDAAPAASAPAANP